MSRHTLDFWFDYSCPYAYLGSTQVDALGSRIDATLTLHPFLLGGVFRAVNTPQNLMNVLSPAKALHNLHDMHRWAEMFRVPLRVPPEHPMRTVEALRATLATGIDPRVVEGFFRAYWVDGRAPSDPGTLRDVLTGAGHDADAVMARIEHPAVRDDLRARTDEAIAIGVFGAPAFVLDGGALYWGQDRIPLIERAGGYTPPAVTARQGASTMHTLELYWDFSSPYAYLAATQAEALAARTGATLVWRPMLLGGVFKAVGQDGVPLASWCAPKQQHAYRDMTRWAEYWGQPFTFPSRFPMNSVKALRVWLALPEARRTEYLLRTFRAYWGEDRDINDEAVLKELIGDDADGVLARTQDPAIKKELMDATQRAVDAGVFGAPAWVVDGGDVYWGQDRMPLVERALRG